MRNTTRGYYIVEAAMLLPLVLLMILALGYVTKAEGAWENAFHCAVDESSVAAARAYDGVSGRAAGMMIRDRISRDASGISDFSVSRFRYDRKDQTGDHLTSYTLEASSDLALPEGFGNLFRFRSRIKYRNFVGRNYGGEGLGDKGLEKKLPQDPVWIFPQSGEKYHRKNCTYVKATVRKATLNAALKRKYSSCSACRSDRLPEGSTVWCFKGDGTAYHRRNCRTIDRHTIVIDRTEAKARGYAPCSKCGGS